MEVYQGKSVFGGIAIGRISVHKKDEQQVKRVNPVERSAAAGCLPHCSSLYGRRGYVAGD